MTPSNDDTEVLRRLDTEPRDDDFAAELARAAPRRWWNRGTLVLAGTVLLVGGFAGGLQAQKQWGSADTPTAAARGFGGGQDRAGYGGQAPGGQAPGGPAPGGASAAAATTGKVKLVNGTTIYVETSDGQVVTVKTDARTSVATATKGKVSDVKAGQSVTIQGSTGSDGSVTATSVTATK
ncbi:hypothetical protein Aab01nite_47900 [Paractinoplanes abujensis]|uniref:DUF5666 domain-containing protein n=1 Tax=Paractinoplanes abujensis TaxID=882441 RepID=A0A7W7CKW7_9ACTN|nr:hypothetical protein [Actinoplanes abujensis]MBB4690436.1 hypothetical protein [Actinoplanes abujensis]GID21200.1 hypothetical protein Aab01nite_47900 [Actinoplanes abujensis]